MEADVDACRHFRVPRPFRAPLSALLCGALLVIPVASSAQTILLRGRVVALGRTLPDTLRIRFTGVGDPRMLRGGEFEIEIPANTSEVEVTTSDPAWSIVYPPSGRLPVPRGDARAVVVVGEPVEQTIARALAERMRASQQILAANGLQAERLSGVEDGIQQILARLDLRGEDLRDEAARKQRQVEVYPEIAATIERYVAEAKDLNTTLSLLSPGASASSRARSFSASMMPWRRASSSWTRRSATRRSSSMRRTRARSASSAARRISSSRRRASSRAFFF
jgi:hypothetical protein